MSPDTDYETIVTDIFKRYGFTDINRNTANMELRYSRCKAVFFVIGSRCELYFTGDIIDRHKEIYYDLKNKNDIRKIATRTRSIAKKAKAHEEKEAKIKNEDNARYHKIVDQLVKKKIAFALNIKKDPFSHSAIITVNGYEIKVHNEECFVSVSIGGEWLELIASKAIELVNMLPPKPQRDF